MSQDIVKSPIDGKISIKIGLLCLPITYSSAKTQPQSLTSDTSRKIILHLQLLSVVWERA